jgi:hypothetical protein
VNTPLPQFFAKIFFNYTTNIRANVIDDRLLTLCPPARERECNWFLPLAGEGLGEGEKSPLNVRGGKEELFFFTLPFALIMQVK